MSRHPEDDPSLRRYLLGELTDGEREHIEERLLVEAALLEELEAAEDDLIEDFLQGALGARERERFNLHFLATAEHQERLEAARVLREHFLAGEDVVGGGAPGRSAAFRWRWGLVAAALMAAIAVAWWLESRTPPPGGVALEASPRAPEPAPAESATPPATRESPRPEPRTAAGLEVVLRLTAGRTMGAGAATHETPLPPQGGALRLELVLDEDRFGSYGALLTTSGSEHVWRERRPPTRGPSGAVVTLRVPASRLRPATDYRVQLSGFGPAGAAETVASYSFRILPAKD